MTQSIVFRTVRPLVRSARKFFALFTAMSLPTISSNGDRVEERHGCLEVLVVSKPLQHFGEHQVTDSYWPLPEAVGKEVHFGGFGAVEEVDPNAGINQHHESALISSRSPSQRSLPLNC